VDKFSKLNQRKNTKVGPTAEINLCKIQFYKLHWLRFTSSSHMSKQSAYALQVPTLLSEILAVSRFFRLPARHIKSKIKNFLQKNTRHNKVE